MSNQRTTSAFDQNTSGIEPEIARRLMSLKRDPSPALVARVRSIASSPHQKVQQRARWTWASVAVVLTLAVGIAAAQPLRAAMGDLQQTIGRVYLTITDRLPDTSDATIVEPELMSLESARTAVPFEFGVPSQVPSGWVMDEQVRVNDLGAGPFVEITWTSLDGALGNIIFAARAANLGDSPHHWLVGAGGYRETEVGGQPAAIIAGGWDHDSREWTMSESIMLIWTVDGVEYSLYAADSKGAEATLKTMAESTR
jgi:hypothetical protein